MNDYKVESLEIKDTELSGSKMMQISVMANKTYGNLIPTWMPDFTVNSVSENQITTLFHWRF